MESTAAAPLLELMPRPVAARVLARARRFAAVHHLAALGRQCGSEILAGMDVEAAADFYLHMEELALPVEGWLDAMTRDDAMKCVGHIDKHRAARRQARQLMRSIDRG